MAHKVDSEGAGPGNTWVEASPGIPKTVARSKFWNMIQEELVGILDAAGIVPDDANSAQLSAALDVLFGSSGAAALKNRLINGAAELWQRGQVFAVGNQPVYTADRWEAIADAVGAGAGIAAVSRQAFTVGQVDVPGDPAFFLRFAQTTPATASNPSLVQKLEDVDTFANAFATVSLYGKADANTLLTIRLVQKFGTGGSGDVVVGSLAVPITTSWARQKYTVAVPSIAGKTVGTGSHLRLELILPAVQTFTLDLANLQAEPGQNATPFERRTLQLEYALAARYFEKSYGVDVAPGTVTEIGNRIRPSSTLEQLGASDKAYRLLGKRFRATKRARPTMTWYGADGAGLLPGTVSLYNTTPTFQTNAAVTLVEDVSERTTGFPHVNAAADFDGVAEWTADAEL